MQQDTSITMLSTSLIIPNKYQPRKVFDEKALNTLAESIKNYGIINPILVRKKDDKYEIIAGERRFRAAMKIGLSEVPVIVKNTDEQQMAELALIENLERQSLTPIEEAKAYEEIMRIGNQTQVSLANKLGKSQASIANKIRLLSLPQEIQDALSAKKISERHARTLISVKEKEKQIQLLNRIINEKLTVKETEQMINKKEIDEEEIKKAISDIMKSLNIQEDEEDNKKEEKEDDNMNNGNFFPNFDNNNMSNNNTSLNMMNMQSMNQAPMAPQPEVVMPTVNQPIEGQQLMVAEQPATPVPTNLVDMQPQINTPMVDEPLFNPTVTMSAPENMVNTVPEMQQPITPVAYNQPTLEPINNQIPVDNILPQQEPTPIINDIPLFGAQPVVTEQPATLVPTNPVDMQPQVSPPMVDEPLFNPTVTMSAPENMVNTVPEMQQPITPVAFEVPVITEQSVTPNPVDTTSMPINKLQHLLDILSTNGYEYKSYSNENTDCIIIEIPRN